MGTPSRRTRGGNAMAALALACALAVAGLGAAAAATAATSSPAAVICADPDLATLCKVIQADKGGVAAKRLSDPNAVSTIFAPGEKAFQKDSNKVADELELKSFDQIYTNPKAADRLLSNLIIPNIALGFKAFKDDTKYKSLLGQTLELDDAVFTDDFYVKGEELTAMVIARDIPAGRSIIHKTDRVLVPDDFL